MEKRENSERERERESSHDDSDCLQQKSLFYMFLYLSTRGLTHGASSKLFGSRACSS